MTAQQLAVMLKSFIFLSITDHYHDVGVVNSTPPTADFEVTLKGKRLRVTVQELAE